MLQGAGYDDSMFHGNKLKPIEIEKAPLKVKRNKAAMEKILHGTEYDEYLFKSIYCCGTDLAGYWGR